MNDDIRREEELADAPETEVSQAAPEAPVSPPAEHDRLDDLLAFGAQFDNIIIKE